MRAIFPVYKVDHYYDACNDNFARWNSLGDDQHSHEKNTSESSLLLMKWQPQSPLFLRVTTFTSYMRNFMVKFLIFPALLLNNSEAWRVGANVFATTCPRSGVALTWCCEKNSTARRWRCRWMFYDRFNNHYIPVYMLISAIYMGISSFTLYKSLYSIPILWMIFILFTHWWSMILLRAFILHIYDHHIVLWILCR